MRREAQTKNGWTLHQSTEADIGAMMNWFPRAEDISIWGGPEFRFPFNRHSFFEDVMWGRMLSYSLFDSKGAFAAFGQLYERYGRINLARLVVDPVRRGEGVGKYLIDLLLAVGPSQFSCDEFSLFVYRENIPAFECYKSKGFVVTDYPDDMPHKDVCYYLTRPLRQHT
jgi:ribosomal protein S18 acetylase RimI-like enzyme